MLVCVCVRVFSVRSVATPAASNLVEVFVDGKPVMVEPGTTVLQVEHSQTINILFRWVIHQMEKLIFGAGPIFANAVKNRHS